MYERYETLAERSNKTDRERWQKTDFVRPNYLTEFNISQKLASDVHLLFFALFTEKGLKKTVEFFYISHMKTLS